MLLNRLRALALAAHFVGLIAVAVGPPACVLAPAEAGPAASRAPSRRPQLIVAPEDSPARLLDAIRSARRRVWVHMYMLTSSDAVSALAAARDLGCEVRVLLEPSPYGAPDANLPAFAALTAAHIDVRWAGRTQGLAHTKLVMVDDTAYVMTLNLTGSGLGLNREYAIIVSDPADVGWAQAVWNADATGADPGAPPKGIRMVTSPIDSRTRLGGAIDGARTSILIEMEEFSDADFVTRLVAARDRGVAIVVVAPAADRSAATTAALNRLVAAGVLVRVVITPVIHAKAMVVDGRQTYVGSVNFTRASLDDNRELGLLLAEPGVAARVGSTIATDAERGVPL